MRVGFEAKRYFHNRTGLGNYARFVVNALASSGQVEGVLYTNQAASVPIPPGFSVASNPKLGSVWRSGLQWTQWKKDGIELYHGLSNELPFGSPATKVPMVVTIHDLLFIKHPELYGWADRWMYRIKTQYACRVAEHIVAISQQTKNDLIELLGVDAAKISVIYQGCDARFSQPVTQNTVDAVVRKYALIPQNYVICVGTIEPRKGQETLIRSMPHWDGQLCLVGRGKAERVNQLKQLALQMQVQNRVVFLDGVADDELPALYRGATVMAYPSRDEGFGIPIIEALTCQTPVITTDRPALREAGGDAAGYVPNLDPETWGNAIANGQFGEIDRASAHLEKFRPETIARQLNQLYRHITNSTFR